MLTEKQAEPIAYNLVVHLVNMVGVGIGAQVGPLNAGVGVNAQLPSIGGLFNFVGQGINAGVNLGAGLGGGLGVGVNGGKLSVFA